MSLAQAGVIMGLNLPRLQWKGNSHLKYTGSLMQAHHVIFVS